MSELRRHRIASRTGLLWLLLGVTAVSCRPSTSPSPDRDRPTVVATTTMLADLAMTLAGDDFGVTCILGPGADPHLYQPRPADARTIAASDLVVVNGLHLEGWIDDLVRNAGGERPVVVASEGVDAIHMEGLAGGVDPHFWFDVSAWRIAVENVTAALTGLAGEEETAARIRDRRRAHLADLEALTSHDAFNYFGRNYGIDVVGIQGLSTQQEASQRDVANVVELVRRRGAPAVFVETSVNPTLIERVAAETGVRVAGPLYSDSLGPPGGPAATYVGMVAENVRLIVEGLGGTYTPRPGSS
jgi:ABC-type Zn uptake system ZnuABC Zn-binding protein ZnuA